MTNAGDLRNRALAAARAGHVAEAAALFEQAAERFPGDGALLNSIGNFHATHGTSNDALMWFEHATAVAPAAAEPIVNRAIILTRLARADEALELLQTRHSAAQTHPRYWTARGAAELEAGDLAGAQCSYTALLQRDPNHPRGLQGRAQVALRRGASDAVAWHERGLAAVPGDRHVIAGLAQALLGQGRLQEAYRYTEALATQVPDWIEGLEGHAAVRWANGEHAHFADHYAAAASYAPSPALYQSWATTLAGVDRHLDAAAIAAKARSLWPSDRQCALLEAVYAGAAGDHDRANRLFSVQPIPKEWRVHVARHRIRMGDPAVADTLLAQVLVDEPENVAAWALRDVAWRLLGDPRHQWLSGQEGLVQELPLSLSSIDMGEIIALLESLHDHSTMPIGQSVKDGSQTVGALLERMEPAIGILSRTVEKVVAQYRAALPGYDAAHPLLRHRDAAWQVKGSWSIRLLGSGRHASHIHPQGLLSSAAYFVVPPQVDDADRSGWLDLGRPPADLGTHLSPMATIRPRPGYCVLFPSMLFHGTRPIFGGTRMSMAFDVASRRTRLP